MPKHGSCHVPGEQGRYSGKLSHSQRCTPTHFITGTLLEHRILPNWKLPRLIDGILIICCILYKTILIKGPRQYVERCGPIKRRNLAGASQWNERKMSDGWLGVRVSLYWSTTVGTRFNRISWRNNLIRSTLKRYNTYVNRTALRRSIKCSNLSKPLIKSPGLSCQPRDSIPRFSLAGDSILVLWFAGVEGTLDCVVHVRKARNQTVKTLPAGPCQDPLSNVEQSWEH